MKKIQFSIEAYNSGKYDVVTRDDRPVEVKFTDGRDHQPVAAYTSDYIALRHFCSDGSYHRKDFESDNDLFLVEKITYQDVWVNQYSDGITSGYEAKEDADVNAASQRLAKHHIRLYSNGKMEILETIYPENK